MPFDAGRYLRRTRDGSAIWIQASYNPVFNADGLPWKVLKFASDVSLQVQLEGDARTRLKESQAFQVRLEARSAELRDMIDKVALIVSSINARRGAASPSLPARRRSWRATPGPRPRRPPG